MKYIKKIIAIITVLALVLSVGEGFSVIKASADSITDYDLRIVDKDGMEWRVAGTFAKSIHDKEGSKYATSGEGWSWDDSAKTLTLNGFDGKQIIAKPAFKDDNLTIVLNGENKVTKTGGEAWNSVVLLGRSAGGKITTTIKGDGKLTIDVSTDYMYCFGGDTVIFEGSPTLICNVHDVSWGEGTAYSANTTILGKDATIRATCSDYTAFTSSNEGWKDPFLMDQLNGTLILENTNKYSAMNNFQSGVTKLGSDRVIYCGPDMGSLAKGYSNIKYGKDGSFYFYDYEDAYKNARAIVICGKNDDLKKLTGYDAGSGKSSVATVSIKKAKSSKKGQVKVTWKKVSKASGYEIYTSDTKDGEYKLAVTVKKNAAKDTIKKQKSKSVIYVKVRAYTVKDGKKQYGDFSKVKSVTVK